MRVLVACEFSGTVRDAFRKRGHDAWSCDIEAPDTPSEFHFQCDVREVLKPPYSWDLVIAHPPCPYLTNSAALHLHSEPQPDHPEGKLFGPPRWVAMFDAADFFNSFKGCAPRVAIENPVPHRYARTLIGKYTQTIQPYQFGHGTTKRTCLWLDNLPKLVPTDEVEGREPECHSASPGPDRWKIRSRTYKGIAEAMADQWGSLPAKI